MVGKPDSEDLVRACHRIIDAASALVASVEMLARGTSPAHQEVLDDARDSVQHIVRVSRALREGVLGHTINLDDLR